MCLLHQSIVTVGGMDVDDGWCAVFDRFCCSRKEVSPPMGMFCGKFSWGMMAREREKIKYNDNDGYSLSMKKK